MKVLFNCPAPFLLAHGGAQIQLEQTMQGLTQAGVEVEALRWWDAQQTGDILHYLGRIPTHLLLLARQRGLKTVQEELLTEQGSRSVFQLWTQKMVMLTLRRALPSKLLAAFHWDSYRLADACIANTPWEARLMREVFRAPAERVHVLPNGVELVFMDSRPTARGEWLVCTATITARKRVLELAEAAVQANTPVWFIGKPYANGDKYAVRFSHFAQQHPNVIRYSGAVEDRAELSRIYHQARGFVLLSTMETRSLAAEEAAASGCPLLLTDLPWARTVYGDSAWYCSTRASTRKTARLLRKFYDSAPSLPAPPKPLTWVEVGWQLRRIYEGLVKTSS